jgi:shikimate kinase
VVLVGIPGAGKSTVGRLAADRLGRPFLDFDLEIERRESQTIAEIFAERGEPAFRRLERELTAEVAEMGGMILAPGGGWILDEEGVAMLRARSMMVWLKVRPEMAIKRLRGDVTARPLLNRPDPPGELQKLLAQREALYARADHLINTEIVTLDQAVDRLVALATAAGGA